MEVVNDNIWLCEDCVQPAVNDDYSSLDYHYSPSEADRKMKRIKEGLERLGPISIGKEIKDLSNRGCDCCGTHAASRLQQFVIVGE